MPNLIEAALASVLLHVLLDIPYVFGVVGGFVLSAASPVARTPVLRLHDRGFGVAKGIPALVMAAASFDIALSISSFGVALGVGLAASDASTAWVVARGPAELAAGAAYGATAGLLLGRYVLCCPREGIQGTPPTMCTATALAVAAAAVLGGKAVGFSGGGAFAVITFGLCLQLSWSREEQRQALTPLTSHGGGSDAEASPAVGTSKAAQLPASASDEQDEETPSTSAKAQSAEVPLPRSHTGPGDIAVWRAGVHVALRQVWAVAQPLLFATVGAAVDVYAVEGRIWGLTVLVVLLALAARGSVAFGVLSCETFLNTRERLFVALACLPKATVQAAIGSLALDAARSQDAGDAEVRAGQLVLNAAVVSIMITAPLGALLIALSGPKLLTKHGGGSGSDEGEEESEDCEDCITVSHAAADLDQGGTDASRADCAAGNTSATEARAQESGNDMQLVQLVTKEAAAATAGDVELVRSRTKEDTL